MQGNSKSQVMSPLEAVAHLKPLSSPLTGRPAPLPPARVQVDLNDEGSCAGREGEEGSNRRMCPLTGFPDGNLNCSELFDIILVFCVYLFLRDF